MDNQKILEHLDDIWTFGHEPTNEEREAARDAIDAVQKQIPMKPSAYEGYKGKCKCGAVFLDRSTKYCGNCGQALDWGEN